MIICSTIPIAAQAIRNRAIAINCYVIEVTYQRVKQWGMLRPVVQREDFDLLPHVWWWALGFANLSYQPLPRGATTHVAVQCE